MLSLKKLLAKMLKSPRVIESGASGIWTYRKWSDGTAECWGIWSGTLTHYATVTTGLYGYNTTIAYPTGLFATGTQPVVTYQPTVGGGFAMPGTHFMSGPVQAAFYAVATGSGSQSCNFSIHVIGKWK